MDIARMFTEVGDDPRFKQKIADACISEITGGDFEKFFTIVSNVETGDPVSAIKGIEYVTRKEQGCGGNPITVNPQILKQRWNLGKAEVKIRMCYKDFENSFYLWGNNKGYSRKDLREADFINYLIDLISNAVKADITRLALLGDEDIAQQNILNNSSKEEFYDLIPKGLIPTLQYFKTINELKGNFVELSQNSATKPYELSNDYAYTLMDEVTDVLGFDADTLLMNGVLAKNYSRYLTHGLLEAHGVESSKTEIQNGLPNLKFDNNKILPTKDYDRWKIADFKKADGTVHLPHFVLYTQKSNLLLGFDDKTAFQNLKLEYVGGSDEHFYVKGNYKMDFKIPNPFEFKAAI